MEPSSTAAAAPSSSSSSSSSRIRGRRRPRSEALLGLASSLLFAATTASAAAGAGGGAAIAAESRRPGTAAAAAAAAFVGSGASGSGVAQRPWLVSAGRRPSLQQQQPQQRQQEEEGRGIGLAAGPSPRCLATATGTGWDSTGGASSSSSGRGRAGGMWEPRALDGEELLLRATRSTLPSPRALDGEGVDDGEEEEYDAAAWEWQRQRAAGEGSAAAAVKRHRRFEVTVGKPLGLYMAEGEGGPVISRIVPGSNAEAAGLRAGDRIVAASAAVGSRLWTKATLAGVESAINSRFRFSDDITFCVERPLAPAAAADRDSLWARDVEVFEVELERPVPLEFMQEDMEGGVFVRRVLREDSEALRSIQPYDRVLAVSATLGDRMWRTRSLDGVLSAISTRWGPRIRLQLERSPEVARLVESYGGLQQRRVQAGLGLLLDEKEQRAVVAAAGGAGTGPGAAAAAKARQRERARGAPLDESGLLLMGGQRSHQVLSQMSGALRERDPNRAISVYKLAVERGIAVDAHCCSSLIKAYGMRREADKALEVVRMMPEQLGVRPDLVTYNALMDACEKGNRLEEAQRIFREELRPEKGLGPDIFSYTVLINALGKRGQLAEALALFEEAEARGLQPELPAYTAVVKAAVRKDDMATALAMLKRMFDGGISPDTRLYNTLIWGHTKRLEWAKSIQILRLMEGKGVNPDRLTYSYLIACLADCRRPEQAAELYREMVDEKGIRPNLELYSMAIDVYAKAGDTTRAVAVFKEMRRQKVVPSVVTYTSLMEAFVTAGFPMAALSISDEMRRNKALARDVTSYVWRIKCFVELGDLEAIEALVQEMVDTDVRPNELVYIEYLRAAMRTAHYDLALRLLTTIYERFPRRRHGLETHEALLELPRDLPSAPEEAAAALAASSSDSPSPSPSGSMRPKEKLVVFYYSALKLMAKHRVRARMTLYAGFLYAAMRAGRLDLAQEVVALRRENRLQIFNLFKKYLEAVEKWEGKVERAIKELRSRRRAVGGGRGVGRRGSSAGGGASGGGAEKSLA